MAARLPCLLILALGMIHLTACGDDDTAVSTPTVTSKTTSSSSPSSSPAAERSTGNPNLDSIIAAATKGDLPAVIGRIEYTMIGCTTQPSGVGSPPRCQGAESSGTQVQVLPYAACEGEYVRPADVPKLFSDYLSRATLYAVIKLKQPGLSTSGFQSGVYGIIFNAGGNFPAAMLSVNDTGKVVNLWRGCGETSAGLFDDRLKASVVLPPK